MNSICFFLILIKLFIIFFYFIFYLINIIIYYSFPLTKNTSKTGSIQVLPSSEEYVTNVKIHNHPNEYNREIYSRTASKPVASSENNQKNFFEKLKQKRSEIAQVVYDRIAQNPKELTVSQNEYLEVKKKQKKIYIILRNNLKYLIKVLNDSKNWWECRNIYNKIGYVPHTILSIIDPNDNNFHVIFFINIIEVFINNIAVKIFKIKK